MTEEHKIIVPLSTLKLFGVILWGLHFFARISDRDFAEPYVHNTSWFMVSNDILNIVFLFPLVGYGMSYRYFLDGKHIRMAFGVVKVMSQFAEDILHRSFASIICLPSDLASICAYGHFAHMLELVTGQVRPFHLLLVSIRVPYGWVSLHPFWCHFSRRNRPHHSYLCDVLRGLFWHNGSYVSCELNCSCCRFLVPSYFEVRREDVSHFRTPPFRPNVLYTWLGRSSL